jgi:hypothetical protein
VIPGTLLGLVALAAALGPGYIYVRRAELHRGRPRQSQLGELVEMVVVGGGMSLLAAGAVLIAIDATGFVDTDALRADVGGYVLSEPARFFAAALAFYGLAYALAFVASMIVYRDSTAVIEPGATGWLRAMWVDLPDKMQSPVVTVELRDGRKIAGGLRSFTAAPEDNREIVLARPLVASAGPRGKGVPLNEDFVVLREDQIAVVSGLYLN